MLLTIIASVTAKLNHVLWARYTSAARKRAQARQKRLGRNVDLFV
jgi:hypothetical protein